MKRNLMLLAGLLAGAASVSTVANAQAQVLDAHASKAAKLELRKSELGKILTTASGLTLYRFTNDPRGKDTCMAVRECAKVWPPLTSRGRPTAGPGVRASLLSTIRLPGGARQVTYAGHPLYLYALSHNEPLVTYYVGAMQFGGTWDAVSATGALVS